MLLKTTVCQTCGDKGDLDLLIYCVQCHDSAVHDYCLDNFSLDDDTWMSWMCEECTPEGPEVGQCRKSERIKLSDDRASKVTINRDKKPDKNSSSTAMKLAGMKDGMVTAAKLTSVSSLPIKQEKKNQLSRTNPRNSRAAEVRIDWEKRPGKNGSSTAMKPAGKEDGLFAAAKLTSVSSLPIKEKENQLSRINQRNNRAAEVRIDWEKRPDKTGSSTAMKSAGVKDGLSTAAQLTGGSSLPIEDKKNQLSSDDTCENQERGKQRRRLILDHGNSSEEESEFVKANIPLLTPCDIRERGKQRRRLILEDGDSSEQGSEFANSDIPQSTPSCHHGSLNMSYCQPYLEPHTLLYVGPVMDPIWRGRFSITTGKSETLLRLIAHFSSKACEKVHGMVNVLPTTVNVKILPRHDIWPNSFRKSPPTDDVIGLYFFPDSERDEKDYESLLDNIIEHDLALKALVGDAELLVFSSLELPQLQWRFRSKYYLWGVFKPQTPN